jgi:hypothetical protein
MSSYNCAFYSESPTRLSICKIAVRLERSAPLNASYWLADREYGTREPFCFRVVMAIEDQRNSRTTTHVSAFGRWPALKASSKFYLTSRVSLDGLYPKYEL